MSDLIDNGGYRFWDDDFSIQSAYEDCKAVFDGITDDDAFQECDTGIILYHAHEIMYALKKALPSAQPNACENTCEIERKSNDMISRQAAIDALDKRFDNVPMKLTTEILQLRRDLRERIPSAEPKTGEWIKATGMMPPEFHGHHCCSECGNFANMETPFGNREDLSRFCPNCGIRMVRKDGKLK